MHIEQNPDFNLLHNFVDLTEKRLHIYKKNKNENIYDIISFFLKMNVSDEPFYIVDLSEVYKKYYQFIKELPRVEPFYAIKSNPDPMILEVLKHLNVGFDCASENEIKMALATGVKSEKLLFANPTKDTSSLSFAREYNIDFLTFDSKYELDKIKLYHPNAKCIIRIKVDDSGSECKFSNKFGCESGKESIELLQMAKNNDLNIAGISFHVGSGCKVIGQYEKAMCNVRNVYNIGKELGFNMNIVDIGGGFPGFTDPLLGEVTFEMLAEEINASIYKYFNDIPDIRIIAEPGRFFCSSSHTLVTSVIGIKDCINNKNGENEYKYTINESIYGSFNCIIFDHIKPKLLSLNQKCNKKTFNSVVFGRTCDGIDKIVDSVQLPKLVYGDKLFVENFGAYTRASSSSFNGFTTKLIYYMIRI